MNSDYNLAINVKNNPKVVTVCAKRDWRRFFAEFASTVGVKIDWTIQINPIVSASMFDKYKIHNISFGEQNEFRDTKPDGLRRIFIELAMAIYGGKIGV